MVISKPVIDVLVKVGIEIISLISTLISRKPKKRRKK